MTRQFSIVLSADMADIVERKLKSGSYSSASDVMRDGLLALVERDEGLERWLREEVVAGHAEYLADPSKGVPATEVMDRIRSRRVAAKA
jgi:putative addiction module CopG family antidote